MDRLLVLQMQDGGRALQLVGEGGTGGASRIHRPLVVDAVVVAEAILLAETASSIELESQRGASHRRGEILLPIGVDEVDEVAGVLRLFLDLEAHRDEGHRAMTEFEVGSLVYDICASLQ